MDFSSRLDPVNALAAHFRSSGSGPNHRHGVLRVPSWLRGSLNEKLNPLERPAGEAKVSFAAGGVKDLVESIDEEEYERWCLLDDTAFTFVTKILLEAEPCLAKDQGLFRAIEALETLQDENSGLSMSKELLVNYKNLVGDSLAVKLLDYFVETKESEFSRRWAGLLLVELLGDSEMNRERVWKIPDKTLYVLNLLLESWPAANRSGEESKSIGEIIISGTDRMLKVVAGKIIWQIMQDFEDEEEIRYRLPVFCQPSEAGDFTKNFPLQYGSQWENGFASFITDIEENRYKLDIGLPTGYKGYHVKIGDRSPINTEFGVILISIAEIFSIYIPPNRDHSPDWVDFKIVNISKIEFTSQGVTGDTMKDYTYFKLHLCDYEEDGYLYLLSMRPSSDSDNVMILCCKADADEFAEDVERYKSKVLKQRSNKLPMSSAPVKDIQANPAHRQSRQAKLDELERHRDDILKVLESPEKSHTSSASVSDPDENEGSLNLPVNKRGLKELEERTDPARIGGRINGSGSRGSAQGSRSFSIPKQQSSAAIELAQGLVEMPETASEEIEEVPSSNPLVLHTTAHHLDDILEVMDSSGYPRPSVHMEQAIESSDSELTDVTDIPDKPQVEPFFRDMPARGRISERPAKLTHNLRKTHKAAGPKIVRRLEFPAKEKAPAAGLKGKLKKKPEVMSSRPLDTPAWEQLADKAKKIPQPVVPSELLFRDTSVIKNHPESNHTLNQQPQSRNTAIIRAPESALEMAMSVEANQKPKEKPKPAARNFSGLSDDVLIVEEPMISKNGQGRSRKIPNPNIPGSLDILVRGQAVQSGNRAEMKLQPLVLGGLMALDTSVNESLLNREDIPKKKTRSTVPKIGGNMYNTLATKNHMILKDDLKKEPRPAAPNPSWLLDITPLSTYEAKHMVQQKGKLKDRLTGKDGQSRMANYATGVTAISNAAQKPRGIAVNLEKPKLLSPEDTSIWDLPESENSGKEDNLLLNKEKGKGKARLKEPTSGTKSSRAKQRPRPKKRVYGKKSVIIPELKPNEVILDSDEEMKLVGEELPIHAPILKPKPRKKSPLRSTKAKHASVQKREDEEIISVRDNKLSTGTSKQTTGRKTAPALMPAKVMAIQDIHEGVSLTEQNKLPVIGLSVKSKAASSSVSAKRVATNKGEDGDTGQEEEKNLPARLTKLKAAQRAHASVPAKRMVGWDSAPAIKRKKPEHTNAKTTSGTLRPTVKKAPVTLKKHIFQNTSEADENSSWRPKARPQTQTKSASKFMNRTKKAAEIINEMVRGESEAYPEISSSDESPDESQYMSSPTTRSRKVRRIPGDSRALSTGVSDPKTIKWDPTLSPEFSAEISTKPHWRGNEIKRTEAPKEKKFRPTEKLIPEALAQLDETNRTERNENELEDNHINPGYGKIVAILSCNPESDSSTKATDITDPMNSTKQNGSHSRFSLHKWPVVAADNEPKTPLNTPNATSGLVTNQSEAEFQLHDDIEMSDELTGDQDMKEKRAGELQKQDLSSITRNPEQTKNQAPTTAMGLGTPSLPLMDVTDVHLPSGSSRDSIPLEQGNLKLMLSVTLGKLDNTPKTPVANLDALTDDHLARKAQIISWGSDGPKNQGRNPAADQRPVHLNEQVEYSTDSETRPHSLARPLSLFVLASEDEDRIVRRKKSNPFIVHPARRSMEVVICTNGSPSLAATNLEQVDTVGSPKTDNNPEGRGEEEEEETYFPVPDVEGDMAEVNQESSEDSKQKNEPPIAIKKPKGPNFLSHIDFWSTKDIDIDSEIGDEANNESEVAFVADPLEESTIPVRDSEPVVKEESFRVHREDRQISIIEISDDEPKETEAVRLYEAVGHSIAGTRNSRPSLFRNKSILIENPSLPTYTERLLAPDSRPISAQSKSLAFQSVPSVAKETSPASDDAASNSKHGSRGRNPFLSFINESSAVVLNWTLDLVKGNNHNQTTFFKWLQGTGLKLPKNDQATPQEFSRNLQLEDPDRTLINEGDFDEIEMGYDLTGKSQEVTGHDQGRGRDLLETDSDDSSDFNMDNDRESDSDEDEEDEEFSEEDENAQLAWRQLIPDHHGETLAVLDQISQGLLRYLMSGEELAMEVIKDFEKQGNEIVRQLGESHKNEYEKFLLKVEAGKQKVVKEHAVIMEAVEGDIAKLQEEKVALAELRAKMNDNYNTIDDTIAMLMAQLEGELEGTITL